MTKLPINIIAEWDPDASVWVATSEDIRGFVMEDVTIERLVSRVPGVLEDLMEGNHPELAAVKDISFHVSASMTGYLSRS